MKTKNNIFIIGGGFVARALEKTLQPEHTVHVITRKEVDYCSIKRLSEYISPYWGSYHEVHNIVINCSGFTGRPNIDQCEFNKEATWKYNTLLPLTLEKTVENLGYNGKFCQISSGCIFTNYEKYYNEEDKPNFGLFDKDSSFYSKSKHAAETLLNKESSFIWRIRMPFTYSDPENPRNYLTKIRSYNEIIDNINSRTCIEDFCNFVQQFVNYPLSMAPGIYNVVNPSPLSVHEILEVLPEKYKNPLWRFIETNQLQTKAGRSNCILSDAKLKEYNCQLPAEIESWKKFV